MAEVLGTTDLHTIGVDSSILSFATMAMHHKVNSLDTFLQQIFGSKTIVANRFSFLYAESGIIGNYGRL